MLVRGVIPFVPQPRTHRALQALARGGVVRGGQHHAAKPILVERVRIVGVEALRVGDTVGQRADVDPELDAQLRLQVEHLAHEIGANPFVSSWCEERRCVTLVRACPAGVSTERLTLGSDGTVIHEGSGEGAPRVQGTPCDLNPNGSRPTRIYSFRAETAGRYVFTAALNGGPCFDLCIYLRRYCAFGDRGVEQPPRFDRGAQAQSLTTSLERGEEVYLWVSSIPVIAGTPVGGYRLDVQRSEP